MLNETTASFTAIVPNNQYFAIGFGKTMTNCDMVLWQANGNASLVTDLWSTGRSTPGKDAIQNYQSNFTFNGTHVEFVSVRLLNTSDAKDAVIPYVREIN